jgi:predicted DNA-binding transcriptional regulator AlpA
MERYSTTKQVAELVGIGHQTLLRWIYAKDVAEPKVIILGRMKLRLWTKDDIRRVRKYKVEGHDERQARKLGGKKLRRRR